MRKHGFVKILFFRFWFCNYYNFINIRAFKIIHNFSFFFFCLTYIFFFIFANDSHCLFVSNSTSFNTKQKLKWWKHLLSLFSYRQDVLQFDCIRLHSYAYHTWFLSLNSPFDGRVARNIREYARSCYLYDFPIGSTTQIRSVLCTRSEYKWWLHASLFDPTKPFLKGAYEKITIHDNWFFS